jgi:DNA replication protein DnaC
MGRSSASGGTLTTVHSFDNTDGRYQRRSTILTSQLPVAYWHEQIGDPSIADSIMDRLVHNAYRIELDGESMRKLRGRKPAQEPPQCV